MFLVQLGLNALWSYLFFGLNRIDLALLESVGLWVAILVSNVLGRSPQPVRLERP